jgi:uncharacterized Zn-binding protein involved in type VI secretion
MAAQKIIRIGDPTSHGGVVITGSPSRTIGGKGMARKGDKVDCPQKYPDGSPHGVNEIIEGEARMPIDGIPVALAGMRTVCGCTLIGTGNASYGGDGEAAPSQAASRASIAGPASPFVKTASTVNPASRPSALAPRSAAPVATPARYVLTIYAAAPGTPLAIDGGTSLPGHMYYTVSDLKSPTESFGFAPIAHGSLMGPGDVVRNDLANYQKPRYARRLEITRAQFDALLSFGRRPEALGFSKYYEHAYNNCVDFVWNALRHAGLVATTVYAKSMDWGAKRQYEGELKPNDNMVAIRSIKAPFPSSEFNAEQIYPMPERTLLQRMLSEDERRQQTDIGRG